MSSVAAIRSSNTSISFPYSPVAVFIGGTSGIGQGIAEAFARHTQGRADIILVGRNRAAAEAIISSFPQPSESELGGSRKPKHEFLVCDATLMRNVHSTSRELLTLAPKINFLVMCPGFTSLGWDETDEGIEKRMALHYYARWKFIQELLPALERAKGDGEDAKVLSTLTTNRKGGLNLNDPGLKKTKPSSTSVVTTIYNDLMIDELTVRHPSLTFIHGYPGQSTSPSRLIRVASVPVLALLKPMLNSKEDVGEYFFHGMVHTASKAGGWRLDQFGEEMGEKHKYAEDVEARGKLWEHTEEVMKACKGLEETR
ncbi:hypothetical protein BT96DRAFT_1060466 [Gymnopus androsaceus JB14]|uniref:NAD(P)-binding protein n=1 Tax=Gymnopus androsaceus JB14 TaxID=1447944 RepID=A0A6A4I794_9AGAR|nr:hypothetical protein BT96DRAFT_1060466 [Gymnopus androsaceus JB14]